MRARAAMAVLCVGLLAAGAAADEQRGLTEARRARRALLAGDVGLAARSLEQARVEWPDAPLLDVLAGDVAAAGAAWPAALQAYGEALDGGALQGPALHAHFNRGVSAATGAEAALSEAGVPLDRHALPAGAPPAPMIEAIEQNLPLLQGARDDFLGALDLAAQAPGGPSARARDAAARQSIAALDDRIDELREMLEDLQQQQSEEGEEGEQGSPQDEQGSDGQSRPEGQDQGDTQPADDGEAPPEPPDEPPPGEEEQDPGDAPPQPQTVPPGEPRDLSPEELQRLVETLQKLEERARQIDRMRAAGQRRTPEKDW